MQARHVLVVGVVSASVGFLVRSLALRGGPPHATRTISNDAQNLGEIDLGDIVGEQVLSHDFLVRNDSHETWRPGAPEVSCGCLSAKVSQTAVEPGGVLRIEAAFSSHGMAGEVRRSLKVRVSKEHLIVGSVRAFVVEPVGVHPAALSVSIPVGAGTGSGTAEVSIPLSEGEGGASIEHKAPSWIQVDVAAGEVNGRRIRFHVTVRAALENGAESRQGVVDFHLVDGKSRSTDISLGVAASRLHKIRVGPRVLLLSGPGPTWTASLSLQEPLIDVKASVLPADAGTVEIDGQSCRVNLTRPVEDAEIRLMYEPSSDSVIVPILLERTSR